jgi:type II secretory pathway component GspD/PulD (secretin)
VDIEAMKKSLVFFCVIFCTCFLTTLYAAGETASGDELISLNVEQKPLREVLAMLTKITGHAFIIDDQLQDMPVSISAKAIPLHRALKIIFADINNAIVYQSDGKIKIIVYNEAPEKNRGSASQQTTSQTKMASSPAAEQESESSEEAAPEPETENLDAPAEEGGARPAEEQELEEEQTENTAQDQGESTEAATD